MKGTDQNSAICLDRFMSDYAALIRPTGFPLPTLSSTSSGLPICKG